MSSSPPGGAGQVQVRGTANEDVEHRVCPRRRISSAPAVVRRAAAARKGWTGANQVIAPEYPSARRAILLHTGQPTANQARTPPTIPNRLGASLVSSLSCGSAIQRAGRTYVAASIPARIDEVIHTG